MKKAWIFLFFGLTVFLFGMIVGIIIGNHAYGSEVVVQYDQPTDSSDGTSTGEENSSNVFLVNINTASVAVLDTLPGIGPALAQRIVDYREANGPFESKEDLTNVSGIGKQKLKAIYDLIIVEVENENTGS